MDVDIIKGPGNAAAELTLAQGETVTAEGGSMIAMDGDMSVETTTHKLGSGNILQAAKRMLAGESFFMNHYTARADGNQLWLAPALSGDMMTYELQDESLIVQNESYLACENGVDVTVGWQGFKSIFSGEGLFWIQLQGSGKTVVNAFGNIYPVEVENGREVIVDTGHIVAFNESLQFRLSKAGNSWISSILGGEGLVCRFSGHGTVWCQSHSPASFGHTIGPQLRPRKQ